MSPPRFKKSGCLELITTVVTSWSISVWPPINLVIHRRRKRPNIHIYRTLSVYDWGMKRIQIHVDEELDGAAQAEAVRRGISKAALIRASLARELQMDSAKSSDPWESISGWLDDDPVGNIDEAVYGSSA